MNPSKPAQDVETNTSTPGDKRRRRAKKDDSPDTTSRLERKRLSDRRSQRAMREKTKQRIAELESALQALLATNVNRELKEKIAENQALKEEVARLRARLERIGRLCFADSEGGASNDTAGCRDPSADDGSPKDKGKNDQRTEILSGNKRRKTSHSHNTTRFLCPQEISPSSKSSTNSPEDGNEAENSAYQISEFNIADDLNPLSANQDGCIPFGDDAFWSVIHSGSNFDTFETSNSAEYRGEQTCGDNQLADNGLSANCSDETASLFDGQGSLDFADLSVPQTLPIETPRSKSSSTLIGKSHRAPGQPTIHVSPGLRSIWSLGSYVVPSRNGGPGSLFEEMVRNALDKYRDLPRETLDTILPAVPCMAPFFSSTGCNTPLSKAIFEQMREGSSWAEPVSFVGAYWCLHSLLRYFIRPVAEEIPWIPSYMLPPTLPVNRLVSRWDFLPWPQIRERIIAHIPSDDDGGNSELEGYIGENSTICWPYSLNEAITFAPPPDLIFGSTGPYTITGCNGCKCSAPQLTDRFKLHLTRAQHWRLKPGSQHIIKKYPELGAVVL